MIPTGPDTKTSFTEGFFQVGDGAESEADRPLRSRSPTPNSRQNACDGARENAKKGDFKIVYDKSYPPPPKTTDFTPIVRAVQAANPDLVVVCSYPLNSVGIVQAANEIGFKPKMFGGAMVGLQATVFKNKLKAKLNGIVNYETWVPSTRSRCMTAPKPSSRSIRKRPRRPASIRSAIISAAGATPTVPGARRGDQRRQEHR